MSAVEEYAKKFKGLSNFAAELPKYDPTVIHSSETKQAILSYIAFNGPSTITRLSKALGLSSPSIKDHVDYMVKAGLLRRVNIKGSLKVEKYYDLAIPFFTDEELEIIREYVNEVAKSLVKYFEGFYNKIIDDLKSGKFMCSNRILDIDHNMLKLCIWQLFTSSLMSQVYNLKILPYPPEVNISWAGFLIFKK